MMKLMKSNAGIDTSKFATYSTKPASISKVALSGLPSQKILKRGRKHSSWQNHYHNFVIGNQISY